MIGDRIPSSRVAVLVFPSKSPSIFAFARKLTNVLASVAANTVLITGNGADRVIWPNGVHVRQIGIRMHALGDVKPTWLSRLLWIAKAAMAQILLAREIFRLRHQIDIIFCTLGSYYQCPIVMARLLRKKVVSGSFGDNSLCAKLAYGSAFATLTSCLVRFNYSLSQAVLVESLRLGQITDVAPFRVKLLNGALFLGDLDRCRTTIPIQQRRALIGYVGRLAPGKGVQEFVEAIPLAIEQQPDLQFLIVGTGTLDEMVQQAIRGRPWSAQVSWSKWVEHELIPDCLNRLKLLVLPSHGEGLPNVILEAMGCGTPVLAADVGGVPDLITDGETGFLLTDNSPHTIAQAIVRVVNNPRLEIITQQARALIERDYSLDAASKRYRAVMRAVM